MSIFVHTKQVQGLFGPDEKLRTDSLSLRYDTINNRLYAAIIADDGDKVILRGKWASSRSEAQCCSLKPCSILAKGIEVSL
jgi:hypothetical protein